MALLRRTVILALLCACALALVASSWAGTQLAPADGVSLTDTAPVFVASLGSDDNHPKVLVARAEDAAAGRLDSVGTCDLQPAGGSDPTQYACRLAAPLPPGQYAWTLQTDYLFCDGDAGQFCDYWAPRVAGPTAFTVAAPAPAPTPAPAADPPTLTPGLAIGAVRLGMTEQQVQQAYGAPAARRTNAVRRHTRAGADYARHGGLLQVTYLDGRVFSIATTSSYYRGPAGVAVGARVVAGAPAFRSFRACGGVLVQPAPTGGETQLVVSGRRVTAVRVSATPTSC